MMEFGAWMHTMRTQRKLDIRAFGRLVGVDASTISRLENTRSQVTFATVVRICERMGIGPAEFLWAFQGTPLRLEDQRQQVQTTAVFTLSDVEAWLLFLRTNWQEGCRWLTGLLNRIVWQDHALQRLPRWNTQLFVVEDIEKVLLDSQVYSFAIQYPQAMQAEDIWELYLQGEVLTLEDVGVYLKKARQRRRMTLTTVEQTQAISASVVSRLEAGALERMKLLDVLQLDEFCGREGKLVALYWHVCRLLEVVTQAQEHPLRCPQREEESAPVFALRREQELKMIELVVTACRWFWCLDRTERTWVREVRTWLDALHSTRTMASNHVPARATPGGEEPQRSC